MVIDKLNINNHPPLWILIYGLVIMAFGIFAYNRVWHKNISYLYSNWLIIDCNMVIS
ncbi:MAG: hypothetical protein K0S93_1574 [Nitrososphaeraceae archaeon]|jgi:hypothetical protein|nr:hypothetical protein [Nitrososphaeraceae archaeon]